MVKQINFAANLACLLNSRNKARLEPFQKRLFPKLHVRPWFPTAKAGPEGGLFVGNADDIIAKIKWEHKLFGHQRTLLQLDMAGLPYAQVARSIEILGTEVAPAIRKDLG